MVHPHHRQHKIWPMPKIMKFLVEGFETHESEGSFEMSFMTKLTLGRIVNFGVLLFLVTPYEERMGHAAAHPLRDPHGAAQDAPSSSFSTGGTVLSACPEHAR